MELVRSHSSAPAFIPLNPRAACSQRTSSAALFNFCSPLHLAFVSMVITRSQASAGTRDKPDGNRVVIHSAPSPPNTKKPNKKTMTTVILRSSQMALAKKPAGSDARASKCAPKSPWGGGDRGAVLWRSGAQVWRVIERTADSQAWLFKAVHLDQ